MSRRRSALVCVDLGRKRVGVALSGPDTAVALPHAVLDGRDRRVLIDQLAELAAERDAEFVVGLPLDLSSARPAARSTSRTRSSPPPRLRSWRAPPAVAGTPRSTT